MECCTGQHLEEEAMSDWEERYKTGDMPWEKGAPHPELVEFLKKHPIHGNVLVPGCGYGHDVRAIASTADEVVGLDIAPSAVAGARQHAAVGGERYVVGDLFALPRQMRGAFDWVFEHTCFCAIPVAKREAYVAAVAEVLKPGDRLFAIFYVNPDMEPGESGPPFGCPPEELDEYFRSDFQLLSEWTPTRTHKGRDNRELCRILQRK
jgi:SAM-dependent methyltransferase